MESKRSLSNKIRPASVVKPHSNSHDGDNASEFVNDQFAILIKLCVITGIPLPVRDLDTGEVRCGPLNLCFFGLLNAARVLNFAFVSNYVSYFLTLNSLLIAFYAFSLCSMAALGTMAVQRRDVTSAVHAIVRTASRVHLRTRDRGWNITRLILAYAVAVLSVSASVFYAVFVVGDDELDVPASLNVLGHAFENERRAQLLMVVRFSMTFAFFSNCAVCGAILLLSTTTYYYLSETIRNFGHKLKKRFEFKTFSQASISENIVMFQRIVAMVSEVDKAFSSSVLFLYCVSISCFFLALSVALSASTVTITLHLFASVKFASALLCFFLLTNTGSRVLARFQELRHLLIDCSGMVAQNYLSVRELTSFTIMAQDIRTADLHLTGGNMFVIRKDMILNVAGVMITYGVLIFQLDKHKHDVSNLKKLVASNATYGKS